MGDLQEHHWVWLESRPDRDREWLKLRLLDGFQVHHIDGDHANNTPHNLALVEGADHMKFHGHFGFTEAIVARRVQKRLRRIAAVNRRILDERRSELSYRLRLDGFRWDQITEHLWPTSRPHYTAMAAAKKLAERQRLRWPVEMLAKASGYLPKISEVNLLDVYSAATGREHS